MLAIIPARGGSKGLPGKNTRLLNGKPLIAWTIEAALNSSAIDEAIISTDDKQIASVAAVCGGTIPFMRPAELAQDDSLAIDTYLYTLDRLGRERDTVIDAFVVLQPTSPLRLAEDIDGAIDVFNEKKADSVISVTELEHPIDWIKKVGEDGTLRHYANEHGGLKNRQDYAGLYVPNGAVFVFRHSLLKEKRTYYAEKTYPYIMPSERAVDIDTIDDFEYADYLMRKRHVSN